jgi:hypothetical protein
VLPGIATALRLDNQLKLLWTPELPIPLLSCLFSQSETERVLDPPTHSDVKSLFLQLARNADREILKYFTADDTLDGGLRALCTDPPAARAVSEGIFRASQRVST